MIYRLIPRDEGYKPDDLQVLPILRNVKKWLEADKNIAKKVHKINFKKMNRMK